MCVNNFHALRSALNHIVDQFNKSDFDLKNTKSYKMAVEALKNSEPSTQSNEKG